VTTVAEALLAGLHASVTPPALPLLPYWIACGVLARGAQRRRLTSVVATLAALAFALASLRAPDLAPLRGPGVAMLLAAAAILVLAGLAWRRPGLWLAGPLAFALGAFWLPVGLGPTQAALRGAWPTAGGASLAIVSGLTLAVGVAFALGCWLPWRRPAASLVGLYALLALSGGLSFGMRWLWLHWPLPLGG
jgi:hypothetical protein